MDVSITTTLITVTGTIAAAILPPLVAGWLNKRRPSPRPLPVVLQPLRWLSIISLVASVAALVIAMWPKPIPTKPFRIYSGFTGTQGSMGEASKSVHVDLKDTDGKPLFRHPPKVIVGFTSLDVTTGAVDPKFLNDSPNVTLPSYRSTLRVNIGVSDIRNDGFGVSFGTWGDGGRLHGGGISWIAYEDE